MQSENGLSVGHDLISLHHPRPGAHSLHGLGEGVPKVRGAGERGWEGGG